MDKIKLIISNRIERIFRLYILSSTYNQFTQSLLCSAVIKNNDNDYISAEKTADLFNFLFSNDNYKIKPSNFLHDKNEMADKAIDHYTKYQKFIDDAKQGKYSFAEVGSKTLEAFCKSVEYGYKENKKYKYDCIMLKTIGHIQLPLLLASCISYASGDIDMDQFKREFVWFNYSMKFEPVNIRMFIRILNEIEVLYYKIESKHIERCIKNIIWKRKIPPSN